MTPQPRPSCTPAAKQPTDLVDQVVASRHQPRHVAPAELRDLGSAERATTRYQDTDAGAVPLQRGDLRRQLDQILVSSADDEHHEGGVIGEGKAGVRAVET